jgi:hypothetical protein
MDRERLIQALGYVASYLDQHRVTANVVTVGGAVNTIYLGSRESTHDLDFFLPDASSSDHHNIHQAAQYANKQCQSQLGADWFNNATQVFMSQNIQRALASQAFEQNVIVYNQIGQRGGLTIYAAPWSYAFCGKMNRLCNSSPRPYDLSDAVEYLYQYLGSKGRRTVSARTIYGWCETYRKQVSDVVLQQVDKAYRQKYGSHPIYWSSRS